MRQLRIAVIGAGSGGQAVAAHLTQLDCHVSLWNRTNSVLEAIRKQGGITVRGELKGLFVPAVLTSDLGKALEEADLVIVTVPAFAHLEVVHSMAKYLKSGQTVLLSPGRTGGSLEAVRAIAGVKASKHIVVAEMQSLPYTCRARAPGDVDILAIKAYNSVAAIPAIHTTSITELLRQFYPHIVQATSTLETGLNNVGAILHPAPVVMNVGAIENPAMKFRHYCEGITPSIARYLEQMDQERIAVAQAYKQPCLSLLEWLSKAYTVDKGNHLYATLTSSKAYASLLAPQHLHHRYLIEDVPTGLVPISCLAKAAGVPTPYIDLVVNIACRLLGEDFWSTGRTLRHFGLERTTAPDAVVRAFKGE